MDVQDRDALSLEYKRNYGIARRDLRITDIIDHSVGEGVVCIFGPGFSEEIKDLPVVKVGSFSDD